MPAKTPFVLTLIAINALLFLATQSLTQYDLDSVLALHFFQNPDYKLWQYVSHMFMHADTSHLLFNMFGLFMFGTALERLWGGKKFLMLYFAAGIGAGLIQNFVNWYQFSDLQSQLLSSGMLQIDVDMMLQTGSYDPNMISVSKDTLLSIYRLFQTPMVGASGALYGVLVAYALIYPNHKLALIFLPFPIAAKFFIPAILLLDLFSGVTNFSLFGRNIAHFAHLGGAFIGFILMMYWRHSGNSIRR